MPFCKHKELETGEKLRITGDGLFQMIMKQYLDFCVKMLTHINKAGCRSKNDTSPISLIPSL